MKSSKFGRMNGLVGFVNVLDGQDGKVAVVSKISKGDACPWLDLIFFYSLLGDVEADRHAEQIAICKALLLNDPELASGGCSGWGLYMEVQAYPL